MKQVSIQEFVKLVSLCLPGFRVRRSLLYAWPFTTLLRGYYFESSAQAATFYVWGFVQPLYIPTDYLYFTFGRRLEELGGGQLRRTLTPENMETVRREVLLAIEMQGKPFLSFFNDTQDLARAAARERGSPGEFLDCDPKDPHVAEARAYSWILADELDKALADLHYLISDPELKPEEEWEFVIQQRAREVLAALNRGPEQAKALLTRWAVETATKLRLIA